MTEEMIQQEYYCSFDIGARGAYYSKELSIAREQGRICNVPYERGIDVHTFWDLGMNDTTVIWFVQIFGKEVRVIDHYENSGESLQHYI